MPFDLYNSCIIAHRPAGGRRNASSPKKFRHHNSSAHSNDDSSLSKQPLLSCEETGAVHTNRPLSVPDDSDDVRMGAGDSIVVDSFQSFKDYHSNSGHFAMIRKLENSQVPRQDTTAQDRVRRVAAGAFLIMFMLQSVWEVYDVFTASLCVAIGMIAFQCLTVEQAFKSIPLKAVLVNVAAFGISNALEKTNVAGAIANGVVSFGEPLGPVGLLTVLFILMACMSCFVSNSAVVQIIWPVVVELEEDGVAGISLKQFAVVVAIGASCAFCSPIGCTSSLIVWTPGGYEFSDFVKLGSVLTIAFSLPCAVLTWHLIE